MFSPSQVGEVKAYRGAGLSVLAVKCGRPWRILCLAQFQCFGQLGPTSGLDRARASYSTCYLPLYKGRL